MRRTDQPQVVLGCGPAGLLAAHGITMAGGKPLIISKKAKSKILGAQFLHRAIPEITSHEPDGVIDFRKEGWAGKYAERIYGDRNHPTSWERYQSGPHPAWSMQAAYEVLWDRYESQVMDQEVTSDLLDEIEREFSLAISTIPAWILCGGTNGHAFPTVSVYILPWTPFGASDPKQNFIMYNGSSHPAEWYRTSRIFGHCSTESAKPFDEPGEQKGFKVLNTDCDCRPKIIRAGRFGEWRSGILTHHAFEKAMASMLEVEEHVVGMQP